MVPPAQSVHIALSDFATTLSGLGGAGNVTVTVPDSYLSDPRFDGPGVEGLAIQRLITLANGAAALSFQWEMAAAARVLKSPAVHPLAAVALCLSNATHHLMAPSSEPLSFERARSILLAHKLGADLFTEAQILVCVDSDRPNLPIDLYDTISRKLRPEGDFESLIDDLVFAQRGAGFGVKQFANLRIAVAVILRELLENTDDHAKVNFDGSVIKPNALRGLLVRRVDQPRKMPGSRAKQAPPVPCLEFTVFDSGIGYYNSYRRQLLRGQARGEPVVVGDKQAEALRTFELGPSVPAETEYAILLKCLSRHSDKAIPDPRPGHRGMGLYEVLRALKSLKGLLEIRTGRIHGYRSFLDGELQLHLEPDDSKTRPGMPKASLLDVDRKSVTIPMSREPVRGTVVRVVVPLT